MKVGAVSDEMSPLKEAIERRNDVQLEVLALDMLTRGCVDERYQVSEQNQES